MRCMPVYGSILMLALWALPTSLLAQTEPSFYEQLGGKPAIQSLMDDFVQRVKVHPVIAEQFKQTDGARLASLLTEQVCQATGGPCTYTGRDMKSAHAGMRITKAQFNALVEVLVASMESKRVPFQYQTRILSMLAPMHRDIIE